MALWMPPTDCPQIVGWFDAQQLVTQSGGVVSKWVDVIGGIVATPPNSGMSPGYSATGRNGKPAVLFNGSQGMNFTPGSNWPKLAQPGMLGVSAYLNSTTGNGRWPFFYGKPVSNRDNGFPGRYSTHSDQYDGVTRGMAKTGVGGVGGNALTNEMWLGNDRFILSSFTNDTDGKPLVGSYVDGLPFEGQRLTDSYLASDNSAGFIGYFAPYGDKWDGTLSEVYVTAPLLSDDDRAKLQGFDSWYTGQAGKNLPSTHPYKNAAPQSSRSIITNRRRPMRIICS